jgi:CYTH domain-containing protein
MAKEIERKFLVKGDAWRSFAKGTTYRQGYLNSAKERTVRVRSLRGHRIEELFAAVHESAFGTKQTSPSALHMSANDPKRT